MKLSIRARLAIWQATHKQLLHDEAQYRKRFRSYLAAIVCLSCILMVFYLPFFGVRLFTPTLDLAIILGVAGVIVGLTLHQFHYQRVRIRHRLESSHAA